MLSIITLWFVHSRYISSSFCLKNVSAHGLIFKDLFTFICQAGEHRAKEKGTVSPTGSLPRWLQAQNCGVLKTAARNLVWVLMQVSGDLSHLVLLFQTINRELRWGPIWMPVLQTEDSHAMLPQDSSAYYFSYQSYLFFFTGYLHSTFLCLYFFMMHNAFHLHHCFIFCFYGTQLNLCLAYKESFNALGHPHTPWRNSSPWLLFHLL